MTKLSIITITKNNLNDLFLTISSLIIFCKENHSLNLEFIIVNGGDALDESKIVSQFKEFSINLKLIEGFDRSLYHAMNKGIRASTGDFLWFMNSGDTISINLKPDFLFDLINLNTNSPRVLVFQTLNHENMISNSNWKLFRFVHQGVIYSKSLHESYGEYADINGFTAADYLFFSSIISKEPEIFYNFKHIVSEIGAPGLSSSINHAVGVAFSNWLISKDKSIGFLLISIASTLFKHYLSKYSLIRRIKYRLISAYMNAK